ncbi:hypothetical protein HYX13_01255 [Candidatus Woesearchaeota archaeon]|nr:hypothetical protein [Candidatus Woesearchaeota archaeon]
MYDSLEKEIEEKRNKEIEDLRSRSKPLEELLVSERFFVDEVIGESYATSVTPRSEPVIGGPPRSSPNYPSGYTSRLTLNVTPENIDIPVRTIIFEGISSVRAGEYVFAKIPRYEKKIQRMGFDFGFHEESEVFYLNRSFNSEESAIELTLLSAEGNGVRRDRAVNYHNFVKK